MPIELPESLISKCLLYCHNLWPDNTDKLKISDFTIWPHRISDFIRLISAQNLWLINTCWTSIIFDFTMLHNVEKLSLSTRLMISEDLWLHNSGELCEYLASRCWSTHRITDVYSQNLWLHNAGELPESLTSQCWWPQIPWLHNAC